MPNRIWFLGAVRRARALVVAALVPACALVACGGDKPAESAAPPAPTVSVLDLAVSLRSGDKPKTPAHEVEIASTAVTHGGQIAVPLTDGIVAASELSGDQLPKLASALAKASRSNMTLAVSSSIPYNTVAYVLATARAAGVQSVAFKVRPPGGGANTGAITIDNLVVAPKSKSDEEVTIAGIEARPWSDFATQWEAVQSACRASPTGNCAYKPEKIADGGNLKIALYSAGQGVNVGFFRVGAPPPPAEPAPDEAAAKKGKAAKKAKGKKGKKAEPETVDPVAELEQAPPATEALFQFRAQESTTSPSAVSGTVAPVCGARRCGIVVQGEKATLFVRLLGLLGAAFPDGTPAPAIRFELP